jgi:hypothetical protein
MRETSTDVPIESSGRSATAPLAPKCRTVASIAPRSGPSAPAAITPADDDCAANARLPN